MRLLRTRNDGQLEFTKDIIRVEEIPPYAILSHTWGEQEVLFNDIKSINSTPDIDEQKREGWKKIRFCAEQARQDGLDHFWVDTCCIDKANNTELSEAINSMFRWYQNSDKCYVYLSDVEGKSPTEGGRPSSEWKSAFKASRWFTRGWTLQELLAPKSVEFFSADGSRLGDKDSLRQTVHEITRIPIQALSGNKMLNFDLDTRISWAQNRQTTREEDSAYCLLGIVDCYLPLIYGEGKKSALKRLRKEMQGGEKLKEIRSWLFAPEPSMNYLKAQKQRQEGTGLWLLESKRFTRWKDDPASRLWLYGIPGCGKTILSSTVVQNLQYHCDGSRQKVTVYFYFDFNDAQKQDPELMLRSLLRQLLQRLVTLPMEVEEMFSSCGDGKQQPLLPAVLKVAPQVIRQFTHVYIVLDALDECTQRPELMDLLVTIAGWRLDSVHLLMTSRRERDIEMSLKTFVVEDDMICLQRDVVDEDILRFVQQRLRDDKRLAKWDKNAEVRQEIETALMRGARGMFRWAVCQLDTLAKCRNLLMLRKSLTTLPQTLDQTYDRILAAISTEDCVYAIRILQWLTFSARPLSVREVAQVVAIDVTREPVFDRDEVLVDPLEALDICSSLVTVTTESEKRAPETLESKQIIVLAHYSVQEYLMSDRIQQGPTKRYSMQEIECHRTITKGCLGYLSQLQQLPLYILSYDDWALASYTASSWYVHLRRTGVETEELSRLVIRLLSTKDTEHLKWFNICDPDERSPYLSFQMPFPSAAELYYAALLGLSLVTKLLIDDGVDIDAQGGRYNTALQAASVRGHHSVVKVLLDARANVNALGEPWQRTQGWFNDRKGDDR